MKYLATQDGIQEGPEKKPFKAIFCRHKNQITGKACSSKGLSRISGEDIYRVCRDCGKVLDEAHFNY